MLSPDVLFVYRLGSHGMFSLPWVRSPKKPTAQKDVPWLPLSDGFGSLGILGRISLRGVPDSLHTGDGGVVRDDAGKGSVKKDIFAKQSQTSTFGTARFGIPALKGN